MPHTLSWALGLLIITTAHAYEFRFDFKVPKAQSRDIRELVQVKGLLNTQDAGHPSLPFKSEVLVGRPEELTYEVEEGEIAPTDITPAWANAQACRCRPVKDETKSLVEKNYFRETAPVTLRYLGAYRGVPLTLVQVLPWRWDGRTLRALPDMRVRIRRGQEDASAFDFSSASKSMSAERMLVLGPQHLLSGLTEFAEWKRSQGLLVDFVELEKVGASVPAIQNFLQARYAAEGTRFQYAILVGDENILPPTTVPTSFDRNTPSDLAYFTMDGTDDKIPDVMSSRLTMNSAEGLRAWAKKVMAFEQSPSHVPHTLALASNEGSDPSDVEYVKEMAGPLNEKFNAQTTYFFQGQGNATAADIQAAAHAGTDFVNYIGHGSGYSWPSVTGREFQVDNILGIGRRSQDSGPIVIDVACQNGRFSGEGRFGETWMAPGEGGQSPEALAYYGGSVDISWDPPAIMAVGISREIQPGENRLGNLLLAGQMYLMKNFSDTTQVLYNFQWYHLQGDPSMKIPWMK